jgi:hypothetical protein
LFIDKIISFCQAKVQTFPFPPGEGRGTFSSARPSALLDLFAHVIHGL